MISLPQGREVKYSPPLMAVKEEEVEQVEPEENPSFGDDTFYLD